MAADSQHEAARDSSDAPATTEETPLLQRADDGDAQDPEHGSLVPSITTVRAVSIGIFIAVLLFLQVEASNISALTTIQSTVATDLDALSKASWLTSSYVIAASSTSPLLGRLCKIFSPRICISASSLLFAVGTVVTALAPNFAGFVAGRAIAGIGSAGIVASSIIIVLDLAPVKRRGLYLGLTNTGFTVGVSLGAVLSGALLATIGWREIFLMQVPFSLLAGLAVLFVIPKHITAASNSGAETLLQQLGKVDYLGVISLTTSLVLFLVSMASTTISLVPILFSAAFLLLFLLVEARFASDPIIPLSVLKSRGALLSAMAAAILMMTRWSVLFYSPVYAIAVREWAPSLAGTVLIPANVGFALGGIVAGWLHIRKAGSYYFSCILVMAIFAATLFVLAQISTPSIPAPLFMALTLANGLCTGAALNYSLVHALHLTAPSTHFIITALMATFRGFGASFGSAIGAGIFARALQSTYVELRESNGLPLDEDLLEQLLGSPATVESLKGIDHEIALKSYIAGLSTLFVASGVIAVGAVLLQAGTGWTAPKADDDETS